MPDAYEVLAALARESRGGDGASLRALLWRELGRLADAVQSGLAPLSDAVALESATIHVADPRFRQGATAVLLDYRFDDVDPFRVRATCLVDHGQILLRVVTAPLDARFERIRARVEPPTALAAELPLNRLDIV